MEFSLGFLKDLQKRKRKVQNGNNKRHQQKKIASVYAPTVNARSVLATNRQVRLESRQFRVI